MCLFSSMRLFGYCQRTFLREKVKTGFSTLRKTFSVRESCSPNIRQNCFRMTSKEIRMAHTMKQEAWKPKEDERRELLALWPDIVRELTNTNHYSDIPEATKWLKKVLEYNIPEGRISRAILLVNAYRMMVLPEQLTKENILLVRKIAWSLEIFESFIIVIDDIQDRSKVRSHRPCWYLYNDIGLAAINDALLLQNAAYALLHTHLQEKDCYVDVIQLTQETIMGIHMGQCLDLLASSSDKRNLNLFTMDRFNSIVKYKVAYYLFTSIIRLAMYLAGLRDPEMHSQIKPILLEMGTLVQVQNDFLDCYGDPNVTGKDGTDIEEGKCSWLVVTALERATPEQRKILDECYGSKDPEKVKLVKRLYDEMELSKSYLIYEQETYSRLITRIQQLSCGLPNDLFFHLLKKISNRRARGFF